MKSARISPKRSCKPTKPEGERIRIAELATADDEARWVTDELERLHAAGHRWKDFAVLYRQHAHRDKIVEELSRRKIPFVISKPVDPRTPLGTGRAGLSAAHRYSPFNDIACARVLAAPAWHPRSRRSGAACGARRKETRYRALRHSASTAIGAAVRRLTQCARRAARVPLESPQDAEAPHSPRNPFRSHRVAGSAAARGEAGTASTSFSLSQFVKDWEPKSESRGLPEFLEYLDYFEQAGGTLSLEDDAPGDAVQLMTVHGAKGLEFPHVFSATRESGAHSPPKISVPTF